MCFSATASFAASAALGTISLTTLTKVKNKRHLPLVLIPLFFALQQFVEGLLWLTITGSGKYTMELTYLFSFFALWWWPFYFPFTAYLMERQKKYKKIIGILCVMGFTLGSALYSIFLIFPHPAQIYNQCIYYHLPLPYPITIAFLYTGLTLIPGLCSSQRIFQIVSALVGLFALISWYLYAQNFISVWCFFAALVSMFIYFYFAPNQPPFKKIKTTLHKVRSA